MRIVVSFPESPDVYPRKRSWHAQLSCFVFDGLRAQFGSNVRFLDWEQSEAFCDDDLLVTFRPNRNMLSWKRTISIDNCTLDVDKWNHGEFRKYGFEVPVDAHKHEMDDHIRGCLSAIIMTNDVALGRWQRGSQDVLALKKFYLDNLGSVHVVPHPIDKRFWKPFFDEQHLNRPMKMLVLHDGWRKNSQQLIDLLVDSGFREGMHFDVTDWISKDSDNRLRRLQRKYSMVASCSYSESGPVNMHEFLCQGLMVYGHEEWWDGYGLEQTRWSYDPARRSEMRDNLLYLFDEANFDGLIKHRNRIWRTQMARLDTHWSALLGILIDEVRRAS